MAIVAATKKEPVVEPQQPAEPPRQPHRVWRSAERAWYAAAGAAAAMLIAAVLVSRSGAANLVVAGGALLVAIAALRYGAAARETARLQAALATGEGRFRTLVEHASDLITIIDAATTVQFQNASAVRVLHCSARELLGSRFVDRVHPEDRDAMWARIQEALRRPRVPLKLECRVRTCEGRWIHLDTRITNLSGDATVQGIVLESRDISDRKAHEEELLFRAFHDPLTGLANRALFTNRVELALARIRRSGRSIGLIFVDLDDFKKVNDELGHAQGDRLLAEVAQRLRRAVRVTDAVARLGGDEFALLLEDMVHPADAAQVAERVLAQLATPFQLDGGAMSLTCSLGVAVGSGIETRDELLHNADSAMYAIKRTGSGGYRLYDPVLDSSLGKAGERELELRRALELGEFVLLYQPLVDLSSNRLVGLEAMLHWHHPARGLLGLEQFRALAEDTGLIVPLGTWMIEEAGARLAAWRSLAVDGPELSLHLNLLPSQLLDSRIADRLAAVLQRHHLAPGTLVLEIAEQDVLAGSPALGQRLAELKQLGARIAVDEVQTGLPELLRLRELPIDLLKLDRSVVAHCRPGGDLDTAGTILAFADALPARAAAEGVDLAQQAVALHKMNCAFGQGIYYSKPLPRDAVEGLLRRGAGARLPFTALAEAALEAS